METGSTLRPGVHWSTEWAKKLSREAAAGDTTVYDSGAGQVAAVEGNPSAPPTTL